MRKTILILLALVLLSGCGAAPAREPAAAPPETMATPSSSAVFSVLSHHADGGELSDDQMVIYAQSIVFPPEEDPGYITIREIFIEDSALVVRFDSASGMASIFRDYPETADEVWALRRFIKEISLTLADSCIDMGRDDLDGIAILMSDEDRTLPLLWSFNGGINFDASMDDPKEGRKFYP